jgi:hypothetical protein
MKNIFWLSKTTDKPIQYKFGTDMKTQILTLLLFFFFLMMIMFSIMFYTANRADLQSGMCPKHCGVSTKVLTLSALRDGGNYSLNPTGTELQTLYTETRGIALRSVYFGNQLRILR